VATVDKKLTIQGTFAAGALAKNPKFASIVDPAGPGLAEYGFRVAADGVVIQGFTIGDLNGDATDPVGVVTQPDVSGFKVQFNEIEDNVFGMYLHASGAKASSVVGNRIHDNNVGGADSGNGIYSDQGAAKITISSNIIKNQDNTAILFTGTPPTSPYNTNLTIQSNVIGDPAHNDSGAEILLIFTNNSTVKGNVIYQSNGSGVYLAGGNNKVTVQSNVIVSPATSGIQLNSLYGDVTNTTVFGNSISGAHDSGIRLRSEPATSGFDTTYNTIKSNVVVKSSSTDPDDFGIGDGISLQGSNTAFNTVQSNTLTLNARDGIFAGDGPDINDDTMTMGDAHNNNIKSNVAVNNHHFDLEDLTRGTDTAGTANTWSGNVAIKKNPKGLK
jgi:nitrous oxidase accessory protein NosD